jgi:hypothetical protein
MINSDRPESPHMNSDYERENTNGNYGQQLGISEPVPINDFGGYSLF